MGEVRECSRGAEADDHADGDPPVIADDEVVGEGTDRAQLLHTGSLATTV
jgi:hypothetical protein